MNQELLTWIFGIIGTLFAVQFGLWWAHIQDCRDSRASFATINTQLETLLKEVASLRDTRHEHSQILQKLLTESEMRERRYDQR